MKLARFFSIIKRPIARLQQIYKSKDADPKQLDQIAIQLSNNLPNIRFMAQVGYRNTFLIDHLEAVLAKKIQHYNQYEKYLKNQKQKQVGESRQLLSYSDFKIYQLDNRYNEEEGLKELLTVKGSINLMQNFVKLKISRNNAFQLLFRNVIYQLDQISINEAIRLLPLHYNLLRSRQLQSKQGVYKKRYKKRLKKYNQSIIIFLLQHIIANNPNPQQLQQLLQNLIPPTPPRKQISRMIKYLQGILYKYKQININNKENIYMQKYFRAKTSFSTREITMYSQRSRKYQEKEGNVSLFVIGIGYNRIGKEKSAAFGSKKNPYDQNSLHLHKLFNQYQNSFFKHRIKPLKSKMLSKRIRNGIN